MLARKGHRSAPSANGSDQPGCLLGTADQLRVDPAGRVDLPAGRALDLLEDAALLVVVELDGGRQLDLEAALLRSGEALELAPDLLDLPRAALLGQEEQEVADELVGIAEHGLERAALGARVELRVAQELP